jgi:2-hydroxychromene-2-carboxylate isomerase
VPVARIPYTLDIPAFLGEAKLDTAGHDSVGTRSAHHWRRVRYSYMDCRREANRRGLTIRGPRKMWDSSVAHLGFLWASEQRCFREYHARVFERFWKRELDIEDSAVITALLTECGVDTEGFSDYSGDRGRALLVALQTQAEADGVFGVPSWRLQGELYWGSERLPRVEEALRLLV